MRYELTDEEWTAIKPMLPRWQRGTTNLRPATSHSFNLHPYAYGCGLMSPRPNHGEKLAETTLRERIACTLTAIAAVVGSNDPSRNSDHNSRSALNWAT